MTQVPTAPGYHTIIERAALDPNFDVDKLERLIAMQEAAEQRAGDRHFNEALTAAEAEMRPISTDASNPQTRSRYATHGRLDGAIRPIYTKHGFGISFTTEPIGDPNMVRVVGMLSNGIISRRYEWDAAIETTGAKGTQYTTKTWARSSAVTYAKRQILIMMFNLAISDLDDDGIAASRRAPVRPVARDLAPMQQPPDAIDELIDPQTGEVTEHVAPYTIEMAEGSSWGQFLEPLQKYINRATSIDEVDQWKQLNQDLLLKLKEAKPQLYRLFQKNIEPTEERLANQ